MNQDSYAEISFDMQPVTANTKYAFVEMGSVPGMIFEANACNNNPAWNNQGGQASCLSTYKNDPSNAYSLVLDGIPSTTGVFPFTITATDQYGNSATQEFSVTVIGHVAITKIYPSSGPVGTEVTITGTGFTFTPKNNILINFNGYSYNLYEQSSPDGQTLKFTIPQTLSRPCPASSTLGDGCGSINVTPGDILSIEAGVTNATTNTANFTVTP